MKDKIKVKLDEGAKVPTRAYKTDAGLDLYSRKNKVIPARGSAIFDTGVHVELPLNTVGLLMSKSGLNVKFGLTNEGVIDYGYRGSIVVNLYNNSTTDYTVKKGDKISQLLIVPILTPEVEIVDSSVELYGGMTERDSGGFGSTGR